MIFYLKEEFLSFDHFDIWDENENLVYSADREFFNFGKKLIVQDASGRQVAAVQHVPFSLPCTYALTLGDRYALEVFDPQDALIALCTVLAIDCCDEEHSR